MLPAVKLCNSQVMNVILKPCIRFMKIPAHKFYLRFIIKLWWLKMRAKYQAKISSSEEATFTQTPPGTGIILFATDSHGRGRHLKISST